MKYCFRCGKKNGSISNLNSHLKNKKLCEPIYLDITSDEIVNNYSNYLNTFLEIYNINNEEDSDMICELCDSKFVHRTNYYRHKRLYCKVVKQKIEYDKEQKKLMDNFLQAKLEELKLELKQELKQEQDDKNYENKIKILEDKIDKYDKIMTTNNIQNNTNSNNTMNNQFNININNYGQEDVSKITQETWDKIISSEFEMIPNLIEEIHIKMPENRNLYLANNKEKFALILHDNKWKLVDKNDLIQKLIANKTIMLENIIEKNEGNFNHNRAKIALELCKHDPEEIISVKTTTLLILLNNNTLIRKTYEESYHKKITAN
jgi:hypothetical protein